MMYLIVFMSFLFYTYLGVRQKIAMLCFALYLKLDSLWFQKSKENATYLVPLKYLGFCIQHTGQKYGTKTSETKDK